MYNIKLDENKYYTGSYAKVGKIKGGSDINTLPPTQDYHKSLCYKYDLIDVPYIVSTPVIVTEIVINEETGEETTIESIKLDENGIEIYEDVTHYRAVLDWYYDEEKYEAFLLSESLKEPVLTTDEKVTILQDENELLKGCIMELADLLYS